MPAPVFEGDTIYAQTTILSKRESKSRPNMGLVEIKSTGFKQDGTVVLEFRRRSWSISAAMSRSGPNPRLRVDLYLAEQLAVADLAGSLSDTAFNVDRTLLRRRGRRGPRGTVISCDSPNFTAANAFGSSADQPCPAALTDKR